MKYNDNGEYKEIVVKSVDTLPVGTEVDFDGNEVPSGWTEENNILYQSPTSSGVNTNITLNDNVNNYKYIEIYYITNGRAGSQKVLSNSTSIILSEEALFDTYILTKCAVYDLSNTSLTLVSNRTYEATIQTTGINITQTNNFYITKVIGYKGRIKKTSQYIEGGASLSNVYGTSNENGYTQSYINGLKTYSTSEKRIGTWIDGKPIYRKVIELGSLPNNTYKDVSTGLTHSNIRLTKLYGVCYTSTGDSQTFIGDMYTRFELRANNTIRITTTANYSNYTSYAIIEYTKTTDTTQQTRSISNDEVVEEDNR
jgi:hypothetical protein